jgi:spore coat polysaccharide biosynthesis protein SpsF
MGAVEMKIVATIEARMTSSRLPGKVLLPSAGKPMLEHLVTRLKMVPSIDEIVLATTVNQTDQVLVEFAKTQGIAVFRGSENDVMERVIGAAESAKADVIVEITGDCPIIDPRIVEQTIRMFFANPCDYASNVQVRSYPVGMDTQVFRLETLKKSFSMTNHPLDREHVSRHIRLNPQIFSQVHLVAGHDLHWPELGLTLDEKADYELLKNIIEYFGIESIGFSLSEVIHLLKEIHPEWLEINRQVKRKGLNA